MYKIVEVQHLSEKNWLMKVEATFIGEQKTAEDIKKLLNADKIDVIDEKIFEHEGA